MCFKHDPPAANPRLPRMRFARLRSPLSRKTLGGRRVLGAGPPREILLCVALLSAACEQHRVPCVYEVPEGFSGWVLIEHDKPGCPAVAIEGGKRIYRIPSSGRLCVRDSIEYNKFAKDEYYFVGAARTPIAVAYPGHEGLIRGEGVGGPGGHTFDHFFVGTEQALEAQPIWKLFDAQDATRPPV
jgi:uncharacterized protein DUF6843